MTEQLEQAEQMGLAQFTPAEVCDVLEVSLDAFEGEILRAWNKGRLMGKMHVQTSIYEMARQGNAPAQKQYMDLADLAEGHIVDENA